MFVSKEQNVTADLYIESDAEEIYVPDRKVRKDNDPGDMSSYLQGFGGGANAIVGYKKYIHSASRIAQDNTDQDAPLFPDLAALCPTSDAVKCSGSPVRSHWVMNHLRVPWNTR